MPTPAQKKIVAVSAVSVLAIVLIMYLRLVYEDSHNLSVLVFVAVVVAWLLFAASLGRTGALYRAWRDLLMQKKDRKK